MVITLKKAKKEREKILDPNVQFMEKLSTLEPLLKNNEYPEFIARLVREFSFYLKKAHGLDSTDLGVVEKHAAFSYEDKKLLTKIIEQLTELKYSTGNPESLSALSAIGEVSGPQPTRYEACHTERFSDRDARPVICTRMVGEPLSSSQRNCPNQSGAVSSTLRSE